MDDSGQRDIGVALSGGGHRATVFGLGALLAMADHGLNRRVGVVSSVSGGSIANGIAMASGDFGMASPKQFEDVIGPALRTISTRGILLGGAPATRSYARLALGLIGLTGLALLAFMGSAVAGATVLTWSFLVLLVVAAAAAWWILGQRSDRTERGIDAELLGNQSVRIADLGLNTHHVICTTDLLSGDSFYISPSLVYGFSYGLGRPEGIKLSTAVQASACVPGAFNPRVIPTDGLNMPSCTTPIVVVNDGGTYDNMADQWTYDFPDRLRRHPELGETQHPVRLLFVVNASKGWEGVKPLSRGRLALELAGLKRSQSVQYDVSTARRRQALLREFLQAEIIGEGLTGAFAQISRSPFDIVDDFLCGDDGRSLSPFSGERRRRAEAAEAYLKAAGYTREWWDRTAAANANVPTTLAPLDRRGGQKVTTRLLEHGYVLTVVALHVLHDLLPLEPLDRARFERLCDI
jgi:predicted acylesterase/phospholipase RssA